MTLERKRLTTPENDADEIENAYARGYNAALDDMAAQRPSLPVWDDWLPGTKFPVTGTVEECERAMRKMTDGERGCTNPAEHRSDKEIKGI